MTERNRNKPFESSPLALAQLVSAASSDDDEWTDDDLRDLWAVHLIDATSDGSAQIIVLDQQVRMLAFKED